MPRWVLLLQFGYSRLFWKHIIFLPWFNRRGPKLCGSNEQDKNYSLTWVNQTYVFPTYILPYTEYNVRSSIITQFFPFLSNFNVQGVKSVFNLSFAIQFLIIVNVFLFSRVRAALSVRFFIIWINGRRI